MKNCGFGRFFSQLWLVKANQSCAPGGGILSDAFLSLLCTHCAPTLSGVKPACIFTLHKENIPGWQTELSSCRSLFSGNGLRLRVLCGCREGLVWVSTVFFLRNLSLIFWAAAHALLRCCSPSGRTSSAGNDFTPPAPAADGYAYFFPASVAHPSRYPFFQFFQKTLDRSSVICYYSIS